MSGHGIVAIVDDDEAVRIGLGSLMRSIDVQAEIFASAEGFFESDLSRFACVLSDIQMPGRSGLDLLVAVRDSRPDLPVILMTAFPDDRVRERAAAAGAHRFFVKPCDPNEIVEVVESFLAPPP